MTRRLPSLRPRAVVTGALLALCVVFWVITLAGPPAEFTLFLPLGVSLALVGTLLALRLPRNPIGWLLLAWAVIVNFGVCASVVGAREVPKHDVGTVEQWAAVAMPVVWHPGFVLFVLVMLMFPSGRFGSWPRRAVGAAGVAFCGLLACSAALAPQHELADYIPGVRAPYVSPVEGTAWAFFNNALSFIIVFVLAGVVSLVGRWRRSVGDDRRQVTAFVFPTSVALVVFVSSVLVIGDGRLAIVCLPVLPISLGLAITRYRLYEIDKIVSRTVSYGIVTAVVVGVYVGAVQLVGLALPHADAVAVAAATLAAAAVFTPLRRRVQRFVDRRFNRAHYDTERVIDAFRSQVRRENGLLHVEGALIEAVRQTVHPAACSVWVSASTGGTVRSS